MSAEAGQTFQLELVLYQIPGPLEVVAAIAGFEHTLTTFSLISSNEKRNLTVPVSR